MTHKQLAVLRSLTATAAAKSTAKSLFSRQLASNGPLAGSSTNLMANNSGGYRPTGATISSQQQLPPHHPQRNRNQDPFAASTPSSKSKNSDPATSISQQRSKTLGGFKSSTVQLEVELVERLNEIERSKVRIVTSTVDSLSLVLTSVFFDSSTRRRRVDFGHARKHSTLSSSKMRCAVLNNSKLRSLTPAVSSVYDFDMLCC